MSRGGWLSLLLVACAHTAPAPKPEPAATKIEIPEPTGSADPEPSQAAAPTGPAEVREPDNPACRIAEKRWTLDALRLTEGGASFTKIESAPGTLVLPAGEPRGPTAVFEDGMVVLRGVIDRKDTRVYPRTSMTLGGFLVPMPRVAFQWLGGSPGRLRLGVDAKAVLAEPSRVDADVSCDALSLNVSEFAARDVITKRTNLQEKSVVQDGAPLAEARGGPALARLKNGTRVAIVEVRGPDTKVLVEGDGYFVFGWVPSADLRWPPLGIGHGIGLGRIGRRYVSARGGRTCARALTLLAEVGSERAVVGTLKKGTALHLVDEAAPAADGGEPPPRGKRAEPRFQRITLPQVRWLVLEEKARLLIPEDEWKECATPP